MRKIRLSDTDIEFFDLEVSPAEFMFFQKHKDAFRCMWKEQGKPFWTKFTITFRSFTVKHGVIKQMSCDTPKFENFLDQAFIHIHEQFVDGKEAMARGFIDECARLAQNHDKFPHLDSKSFTKDPFYSRDTRDLFRRFFGNPDQKNSYVKVYVLSPIYLRFGGSVCRCLKKWMNAPSQDCEDESYWIPPSTQRQIADECTTKAPVLMCTNCLDDCGTRYFKERICGQKDGPKFLDYWKLGDPRFNDPDNPLYNKKADRDSDWRDRLSPEDFRDFVHFAKFKYGTDEERCRDCSSLVDKDDGYVTNVNQKRDNDKKKKKKRKKKDKQEIAKEKRKDEVEVEVQRIIDHITGKNPQQDMPPVLRVRTDTTIVQADSDNKSDTNSGSPGATFHNIAEKKDKLFGFDAKCSDDVKPGILGNDNFSEGNQEGGFRVFKLEDERSGAKEITISVNAGDYGYKKDANKAEGQENQSATNRLSVELIKSRIENLPDKMEWWEGVGWCACVINYEIEEKDVSPNNYTNFTIKVNGKNEMAMQRVMFKLLTYVSKRKKRPSPGWTMDDNDVVASINPEEIPREDGIIITLQHGFRFEERLTKEERKTMSRGRSSVFRNDKKAEGPMCVYVQPQGMKDKEQVLMALDVAVAKGDQGQMNFKKLLTRISGHCIDDKVGYGTPNYPQTTKSKDPSFCDLPDPYDLEINKTPMWDQILLSPRTFELLFMVNKDREHELKELGLRRVDPENVPGKGRDKQPPLQSFSRTRRKDVFDCICIDKVRFSKPISCNCTMCRKMSSESKHKTSPKPTPSQDKSSVTKTTPTPFKDTPSETKTTPAPCKDTPTETRSTPTPYKDTPIEVTTAATPSKDIPSETKSTPTPSKDTPTMEKKTQTPPKDTPTETMSTPTSSTDTISSIKTTNTLSKDTPIGTKTSTSPSKDTPTMTKATPAKETTASAKKSQTSKVISDIEITEIVHDKDVRPDPVTTEELEYGFELMEQQLKEARKEKMNEEAKKKERARKREEEIKKEPKKSSLGKRLSDSAVPPKPATPKMPPFSPMPTSLEYPLEQILKGRMEGVFKFTAVQNQSNGTATSSPLKFTVENVTPQNSGDPLNDNENGKKKEGTPTMSEEEKIKEKIAEVQRLERVEEKNAEEKRRERAEEKIAEVRRRERAEESKKPQKVAEIKRQEKLAEIRKHERRHAEFLRIGKHDRQEINDALCNFKFKPKEEFPGDVNGTTSTDTLIREALIDVVNAGLRGDEEESSTKLKKVFHDCIQSQVAAEHAKLTKKLRKCTNCQKVEPSPKTYKKCLKCKEMKVKNARYYCGKECQANDWTQKHKKEHKENRLD
ncbi:uncharacterized protein LOC132557961 [Ylistrum balloti]|uniref:uncharacterized protein LOC132557961 n=1 Tax=Ylistrum balloti TaxID=509963 RepID=UPI0029059809|nr:uncharacterized protein LOC132557961 [Ylistrum balloti]